MHDRISSLRPAFSIASREVKDQFRDWRIIFPILGLTLFFPFLMNFTASQALGFVQKYGADIIADRLVPFLQMLVGLFPISVSLVIALDTFVGEKERGSIEPLLSTPLKDWQLYLGKLMAATIPPLASSFLGMAVYLIGLLRSQIQLPTGDVLIQIFALTIAQAFMMVSGAVVVSTQATSVRAANLLASFIIIPSALLIQGESVMMFWGTNRILWWAVLGLCVLTVLMIRVGLAHFKREELLGREIDVLNFRWGFSVFARAFFGQATGMKDWYKREITGTLHDLRLPITLVALLAIAGVFIGAGQVNRFMIPLNQQNLDNLDIVINQVFQTSTNFAIQPVIAVWWQNVRVLILSLILGLFSFGVLGVLPLFASTGLAGYLVNLLLANHIAPWYYILGIIFPHGIIEIPAAIIAGGAVLKLGAILATPVPDKTVGEVWIIALANWCKVMVGVVFPVLLIAAVVETWLTPRLAALFF